MVAHATLLAQKDGLGLIEAVHVIRSSRRVNYEQSSIIKWVLLISTVALVGFALFQMAIIYASSQVYLWLLPLFSILWVGIATYVFRDFL